MDQLAMMTKKRELEVRDEDNSVDAYDTLMLVSPGIPVFRIDQVHPHWIDYPIARVKIIRDVLFRVIITTSAISLINKV
jgi:hypothetical protein